MKDRFYDDLSAAISKVPPQEPLFIFGDFNARVGADHSSWPTRDTIYNAASLTFGKKQAKTADWFEAHLDEIQPLIDEKRRALASYKSSP